jgi:multisubunit Na+/H+ antiporter MnhE subunit
MKRFMCGLIIGPIVAVGAWHLTHHTMVTWICGVTVTLLVWFGAPIFKATIDVADDLID